MCFEESNKRTTYIIHQCRKTTVLICHRCLINIVVGKNEQHSNIVQNFEHQVWVNVGIQTIF